MPVSPIPVPPERCLPGRPLVKPALRRLWRSNDTLQLGLAPQHAVVLAGLGAAEVQVLELLDGSRDAATVVAEAQSAGLDTARVRRLVEVLADAGALDDATTAAGSVGERERQRLAPDRLSLSLQHRDPGAGEQALARRRQAGVVVHGAGRVGASVAGLLAAAGIGRLGCVDDRLVRAADLCPAGIPEQSTALRDVALVTRLRRTSAVDARTDALKAPTVAVVAPAGSVASPEVLSAVRRQPHLLVAVRETTAVVGPFVLPGVTACLRCIELSRGERDPHWPALAAQLVGSPRSVEPCDVALATLAASLAVLHVLAWVDSDGDDLPISANGVVEFDLGDGRLRRRSVSAHPGCGCSALGDALR